MVRADSITPADIVGVLLRYAVYAVVLAALCAAGAYGYSLWLPDQFTASTLVLVEGDALGNPYVRSAVTVDLEARLRTLRERVLSRTNLQQVMDRFGLDTDAPSWELRLQAMSDRIDIGVTRSDAFTISFKHGDPDTARDVTNALAQLFIDDSHGAMVRQSQDTSALLDQRLRDVGAELQSREQEIAEFKALNRGSLPDQVAATLSAHDYAESQLAVTISDLAAARERRGQLERLAAPAATAVSSPGARQLAQQLLNGGGTQNLEERLATQPAAVRLEVRRLQREALLQRYTPLHPDVQMLDMEIRALEAGVTNGAMPGSEGVAIVATDQLLAGQLESAQREVSTLETRRAELQRQIADYETRLAAAPQAERQLRDMERQYDGLAAEYRELRGRNMDATLTAGTVDNGNEGGFKVLDPAVTPQRKSAPQRSLFFIAGAVIGLALAYGAAFAYEIIAQPLHGAAEIERHLGVPVLSVIPVVAASSGSWRERLLWSVVVVLGAIAAGATALRLLV